MASDDFEQWMKTQGESVGSTQYKSVLSEAQATILKEYPDVYEANDLPIEVQQKIISMNKWGNTEECTDDRLQGEVDAFLAHQYSLVTQNIIH